MACLRVASIVEDFVPIPFRLVDYVLPLGSKGGARREVTESASGTELKRIETKCIVAFRARALV